MTDSWPPVDVMAPLYWGLATILILLAVAFWWYIWKKGYLKKGTFTHDDADMEPAGGDPRG